MNPFTMAIGMVLLAMAAVRGDDEPMVAELKKLEGTYRMVRGEEGGVPVADDVVRTAKLTITGDRHVVQLGSETIRGTHTVNPLEKPKSIDPTDTTGRFAGKTVKGIYKLEGNEFTIAVAPPNEDRPLDFTTEGQAGTTDARVEARAIGVGRRAGRGRWPHLRPATDSALTPTLSRRGSGGQSVVISSPWQCSASTATATGTFSANRAACRSPGRERSDADPRPPRDNPSGRRRVFPG